MRQLHTAATIPTMFSGIISGQGRSLEVRSLGADAVHGKTLTLQAPAGYLDDVQVGDSIALNGACMTATVIDAAAARFQVDVSAESLARTAGLEAVGPVNLEKALRAHDRLGGHLVSGHVDGVGRVTQMKAAAESMQLRVLAPSELARFLAEKGSITIDGVSLTVNRVEDLAEGCTFSVNLIPHTLQQTTLGCLQAGQRVNLEIDLIARYLARMLDARSNPADPAAADAAAHSASGSAIGAPSAFATR